MDMSALHSMPQRDEPPQPYNRKQQKKKKIKRTTSYKLLTKKNMNCSQFYTNKFHMITGTEYSIDPNGGLDRS